MPTPLLKTKLYTPDPPANTIARTRLYEQLDHGLAGRLTLVAAPAGFGKTTLISCWIQERSQTVAWVSLDELDNDESIFWGYVVSALQQACEQCKPALLTAFNPVQLPPIPIMLTTLINELTASQQKIMLILDDYHVISNAAVHHQISFLIDHLPPQLHIILSTRADPPLPVARLRAKSQLSEIRARDLRFTLTESTTFLNEILELALDPTDIEALEKRTEGWAVGLQLAAFSMREQSDKGAFIADFSGSHHFILEYLTEEVINRLPETQRSFLLQTSVLDSFCVPLCDRVMRITESATQLAELLHNNLFLIPLDEEHNWFRYHHLFADLLKNRLQQDFSPSDILGLYQRAGQWYQEQNDLNQAIKYQILAQNYELAADLIEQISDQLIARGQIRSLLQWLDTLPNEVIKSRPRLQIRQGWVIFLSGQVTLASQILKEAKLALKLIPEGAERNLLTGRLSAMVATITALTRDLPAAISEAQKALEHLPEGEFIFRARATRAMGVCYTFQGEMEQALEHLQKAKSLALDGQNKFLASEIGSQIATTRKHQGKLSLAAEAYHQILNLYEHPEQAPPACLGYIGLAEIALERNDLRAAAAYLDTGIELGHKGSIGYALQPAYLIGGLLKQALGEQQAARETIQKAENLSRMGGGSLESILGLAQYQTRCYLQLGDTQEAQGWAMGRLLPSSWTFDDLPIVLDEVHQSLLARVYLQIGRHEKVLKICKRILPQAEAGGRLARVIELSLFQALALQAQNDLPAALESLERSLVFAEPEGYTRLFLETGTPVLKLLRVAEARGMHPEYIHKILAFASASSEEIKRNSTPPRPPQGLIEPLSERECEVLRLIISGRTNQEIADKLVVSLNTVKKHTTHIYGKLGVKNRTQAIAQARELELFS